MDEQEWDNWKERMEARLAVEHEQNTKTLAEIRLDLKCAITEMARFRKNYEQTLIDLQESNKTWKDMRKEVIRALLIGALLWISGIAGIALWLFIKRSLST